MSVLSETLLWFKLVYLHSYFNLQARFKRERVIFWIVRFLNSLKCTLKKIEEDKREVGWKEGKMRRKKRPREVDERKKRLRGGGRRSLLVS